MAPVDGAHAVEGGLGGGPVEGAPRGDLLAHRSQRLRQQLQRPLAAQHTSRKANDSVTKSWNLLLMDPR